MTHDNKFYQCTTLLSECDNQDRRGFVKKVYAILATQLTFTFGCATMVKLNDEMNDSLRDDENTTAIAILITCIVLSLVFLCTIDGSKSVVRVVPCNFIALSLFTVCWAYIISFICAQCDKEVVLMTSVSTAAITISLTLYAMFTKTDFTKLCGPFVCYALLMIFTVQMLLSWLSLFVFSWTGAWIPFTAGFCVIIYGLFLIIDTQRIVGGGRHELSIDDYIIGAMYLYLNILYLPIDLLDCLPSGRGSGDGHHYIVAFDGGAGCDGGSC